MIDNNQPHNEEDKIRPNEVAWIYGVTSALIYEWLKLGKGPEGFTDKRGVFFTRKTIETHLDKEITLAQLEKQRILERLEKNKSAK
jgi:hypothetical protein